MKETKLTRRAFFIGAAAATAAPVVAKAMMAGNCVDENLSVFISDIHVSGRPTEEQPNYQNPLFEQAVDAILEMRPRPKRVVCFGDIALWKGWHEDYEASLPGFKRITDAGIELYLTMGNHDHREPFLKCHPSYAKTSPVPGRIVSVVDLGTSDLILLDSLQETGAGEGANNAVPGAIDKAQWDWLEAECKRRTRPFFCGAHHSPREMTQKLGERTVNVLSFLRKQPLFRGWIHGHDHIWSKEAIIENYGANSLLRKVALPSTGWWGDIGYGVFRTYEDHAVLSLEQTDYFFSRPLTEGEERPAQWDAALEENRGQRCTFFYK